MKFCSNKGCVYKNTPFDDSEFIGETGRVGKYCSRCRELAKLYRERYRQGLTDRKFGQIAQRVAINANKEIVAGEAPNFQFVWEKKRHKAWLKIMAAQVKAAANEVI